LLRGINVGAKNIIKMTDLKKMFEELQYKNVTTYVQSGNIVFSSEIGEPLKLAQQIEEKISAETGNSIKAFVITGSQLTDIFNHNPLIAEPGVDKDKLHVTFLFEGPGTEKASQLDIKAEENSRFAFHENAIYLYCPDGYGRTKLNNSVFERKLKTYATTRNWNTINNLLEISAQMDNVQ
jgi:uncharacterized protein (DUF1697 family)